MGYSPPPVALLRRGRIRVDEGIKHLPVGAPYLGIGGMVMEWGVAVLVHAFGPVAVRVSVVFAFVVQAVIGAFLSERAIRHQPTLRDRERHHLSGTVVEWDVAVLVHSVDLVTDGVDVVFAVICAIANAIISGVVSFPPCSGSHSPPLGPAKKKGSCCNGVSSRV